MEDIPGVELYFSNSVEELAVELASTLKRNKPADLFESQTVIIPNANLQKWLQLKLAELNGIATNLDFPFLEVGLWDLVSELTGAQYELMLGVPQLQLLLIRHFKHEELFETPDLAAYLMKEGKVLPDRLWQLSGQLSRLFLEYERNRPQIIDEWLWAREVFSEEEFAKLEREQAILYREIFGAKGFLKSHQLKWSSLVQASKALFDKSFRPQPYKRRSIYIFGPSQLSVFHRKLLCYLGRYFKIHIYSLNVCAEFWEDIQTPSEDRWFAGKMKSLNIELDEGDEFLQDVPDNPLLKAWGKPGREALKVFSDLEDECTGMEIPFQSFWLPTETPEKTVLQALQNDILNRQSWRDSEEKFDLDNSIQLAAAPGVYREVESVYSSILTNMKKNPSLKLTDIAVLVPDMEVYKAAVSKVFDGQGTKSSRPVPYSLIDSKAKTESLYARGILSILEILEGDFTRKDLFELFMNECFREAAGLEVEDINKWLKWSDELNIYREFSSLYQEEGVTSKMFTFKQGAQRLLLGKIMELEENDFSGVVPYNTSDTLDLAGAFIFYVERLAGLREEFNGAVYKASVWQEKFSSLAELFLKVPDNLNAELSVRTRLNEAFSELRQMSDRGLIVHLNTAEIGHFIKSSLDGIPASKGSYLGSGVTIASLQPMRPVPFKIIYVMGLGENEFPGNQDSNALDLRLRKRKIGDISLPEKNMYLFLETLICARQKLCLSYVSEDIRKDKQFNPSQVFHDLLDYCNQNILNHEKLKACKIPLKSADPDCFEFENNLHEWLQGSCPEKALLAAQSIPANEKEEYEQKVLPELKLLNNSGLKEAEHSEADIDLTVAQLGQFLRNPAKAILRFRFGISERDEEDPALEEDEPFSADSRFKSAFISEFLNEYLEQSFASGRPQLEELVDEMYHKLQLRSETPAALFGDLDRRAMTNEITSLMSKCKFDMLIDDLKGSGKSLHCNPGFGNILTEDPEMAFDALKFSIRGWQVSLHGSIPYVCSKDGKITDIIIPGSGIVKSVFDQRSLDSLVFWAAARLSGCAADSVGIHVMGRYGTRQGQLRLLNHPGDEQEFHMSSDRQLKEWLQGIIKDYLSGEMDMIPFSTAADTKIIIDVPGEELLYRTKSQGESNAFIIPDRLIQKHHENDFFEEFCESVLNERDRAYSFVYDRLLKIISPKVPRDVLLKLRRRFKAFNTMVRRSKK